MNSLIPAVGGRVSGIDTARLKVKDPLETRRSRSGGGTSESDTSLSERKEVVHPVLDRVLRRHVALGWLVGFVKEQGVLDGSGPAGLERVEVTELVRTPKHGNVFETESVTRSL